LGVSDGDSFIREVSEEVRRERFSRLLRQYGWIGALVILVIVGGAAANEWRKARADAAAQAAGDALRTAYLVEAPEARAEALRALGAERPAAAPVARIAEAGALAEAGDRAGAAEVLAAVAEAPGTGPLYRDLALLQRVALLGAEMDASERLATLETLTRPDGPFRPLALEQRALARLERGEAEAARADLETILGLGAVPEGLAGRARQLLIAAGGSLPAGPAASPDAPPDTPLDAPPADALALPGADG
jgi:hypothetical protein